MCTLPPLANGCICCLAFLGCRFAGKPTPDEAIFATMYASAGSQKGLYPGWDKDLHYAVR